ncbi:MAG: ATP-binding protein [Oscillospiraceae bacterium]|nr:ATP-binding protein [Oscillospiraceae bacterium]MCL2278903.1 ATP-binding protein [Oscillospiraceae bacterium]
MYIKRAIEDSVLRISQTFPVLLVTGPRQVGKTTLLKKLAEKSRKYVSLDDPDVRTLARKDPALFMQRYTPPVTIDEIQYAPEILPYIKMSADSSGKKGDFWLTGSQAFHTMKNVSESLAGRVGIVNLLGLSSSEIEAHQSEPFTASKERLLSRVGTVRQIGVTEIYERIFRGFYPALFTSDAPQLSDFYRAYVNTYLQRDIRDLSQVADESAFLNFLIVVAARTARPIIYEDLAKESGVSAPTAKKWLSLLVSSGIVTLVQPYHNNILKRVTKMPLLHFLDTGLCAYLLKWGNSETLERGAMSGAFFESWVFSEIYKSYLNAGEEPPLYCYRDKDKREIDLLIYKNGMLHPIEIKKSASPGTDAAKHFKAIAPVSEPERHGHQERSKVEVGTGLIVCMANDLLPLDSKNWCVPAWII